VTVSEQERAADTEPSVSPFAWPALIAEPFLDLMSEGLRLRERGGDPHHVMRHPSTGERTGAVQVFDGDGLQAMVLSTANTPHLRMWQAVAFTPPESAVPHLSFDAKANPGGCWFSIDLIPRVACVDEPAWTEYVYEPLSEFVWELHEREDMRQSLIRARHRMHHSPWLVSMRLDAGSGVGAAIEIVDAFTRRFCDLVRDDLPASARPSLAPSELAARDAVEREHLYSWEATANYRYLAMIGGDESVDIVQRTLRNP
jgi:hypothetical protein